jgi:hypothetical protein
VIGGAIAKPKDYELGESLDGHSPYRVWEALRDTPHPLHVGDILESESGDLSIYKYVGFEQVQWHIPEMKNENVLPESTRGEEARGAG